STTSTTSTTYWNFYLSKFYNVILINKKTGKPLSVDCFNKNKPTKFRIICIKGNCAVLGYQNNALTTSDTEKCITIDLNCYDLQFDCSTGYESNCY
ncbi:hypothetical protein P4244_00060, partial [Bacillus thuringiensis]|nr:hypothetical protein [Bacillus thuringiensis]